MSPYAAAFVLRLLLCALCFLQPWVSADRDYFEVLQECSSRPFICGDLSVNVSYPFSVSLEAPAYCGHPGFYLQCNSSGTFPVITISMANNRTYAVQAIDYDKSMLTIVDKYFLDTWYQELNDFYEYSCMPYGDTVIDPLLFELTDLAQRVILFQCSEEFSGSLTMVDNCFLNHTTRNYMYISITENATLPPEVGTCSGPYRFPMNKTAAKEVMSRNISLSEAIYTGFTVRWTAGIHEWCRACQDSGGVCVHDSTQICYCPDGSVTSDWCHHGRGLLQVLAINYGNNSFQAVNTLINDFCPISSYNNILNPTKYFRVSKANRELFFLNNCKVPPSNYSKRIHCSPGDTFAYLGGHYGNSSPPASSSSGCNIATAPVLIEGEEEEDYIGLLSKGFLMEWQDVADCSECRVSGGTCGYSDPNSAFLCICNSGWHYSSTCNDGPSGSASRKRALRKQHIALGSVTGVVGLILLILMLVLYAQKGFGKTTIFLYQSKNTQHIETMLAEYGPLAPKRYKCSDLKKITKSLSEKLGKGGYGSVFKGTLQDGRLVAVKILSNFTENGAEFINEVISIGRTSHVNVVSLLGFCFDGKKRALVYEFLPNGSLEKYIYSEKPKLTLGWDKLYHIAIGIARGLEYLHRGCSMRIVHFDIKPHNILLDEEFCPKISDFGLAKLCPQKESILSMADARGTIGFIAPEVISRNFGSVSTKSDVYSYGMMILEMVGGRKNVKTCAERSSEVYFPHWVYEHLDQDRDLQAYDITVETEEIARKMTLVGLWCIQIMPANRPSMTKVIEMLEGRIGDIEMPPKPSFSSPIHSAVDSPR
ncbi:LEAF RUST 10 DISEASE-RESISTANCE LOCUS RECEPTOR-LIKE PROTEIN KINASE-like 2.1 [Zingiber officinale]|uniref:LEAF RUST 10 DISEASE-RESISTANCE LOCUS RECEPTOR-LIKE PROTEIN KINASE-like 2.1 n=1 Tax=Zingiber officinale TaxID=94328 RepID=UPI001C4A9050|nr:LEAF RUST 10 DISEASE-RESISTANCE LOCUS RECEPTOR-LIKE PROTEIN KINASE-like 2.1 [Zingiber officinale]XP_042462137.1 LEAF RUST 10 DISEASE-RESISTANCE LOCUS RECEPTOR-LIKE PROTEIN KINASE-like 2.1 [Zingiber officinale]